MRGKGQNEYQAQNVKSPKWSPYISLNASCENVVLHQDYPQLDNFIYSQRLSDWQCQSTMYCISNMSSKYDA